VPVRTLRARAGSSGRRAWIAITASSSVAGMTRQHLLPVLCCASLLFGCVESEVDDLDDLGADDDRDEEIIDDGGGDGDPAALVGTTCLNADGPGGQDTYALITGVLGSGAIESPDTDHSPALRHVREEVDDTVGAHFVFLAHRDVDRDGDRTDRSRMEIKVAPSSGHDALKARQGKTFTYTWRFKMGSSMGFSSRFTHMFQLKSYQGDAGAPLLTITGRHGSSGDRLEVIHTGPPSLGKLANVSMTGIKGVWLEVSVRATFDDHGKLDLTIKKPDGTTVVSIHKTDLDLWRGGDHIRPKWGIYRGLSDELRPDEEKVRFANFAITPSGTPTSTCRP